MHKVSYKGFPQGPSKQVILASIRTYKSAACWETSLVVCDKPSVDNMAETSDLSQERTAKQT